LVISVDNVTVGYGEHTVISDFSLVAGAGEAVALLGSNGAGKSTLLRCVAGLPRTPTGHGHRGRRSSRRKGAQVPAGGRGDAR
jgi:ABC-type branched-subunit amino acid transport system ATPase component